MSEEPMCLCWLGNVGSSVSLDSDVCLSFEISVFGNVFVCHKPIVLADFLVVTEFEHGLSLRELRM